MKRLGLRLTHAVAVAGLMCGLVASPALADHHKHNKHHKNWNHGNHHEYYGSHHSRRSYRDYDRTYYYSEPRVEYYAQPRVYVPVPPPPSFGLHLVFPFH